jgi:hypothetical protein
MHLEPWNLQAEERSRASKHGAKAQYQKLAREGGGPDIRDLAGFQIGLDPTADGKVPD